MRLRALGVEGFRCFRRAFALEGLAPGINVVAGPNEAGKSTLFLALTHALLTHHRTVGRAIEELRPFATLLSPKVWCELELGAASAPGGPRVLRVSKQFLDGRACRVERVLPDGRLDPLAEGDAAEELLHSLLGSRSPRRGPGRLADWGIAELLWVPAGPPTPGSPGQDLQARLRAGAEGGALAARDAALCERIEAAYAEIFQEKRGDARRGSELGRRRRHVIDLRVNLSQLAAKRALCEDACRELETVAARREELLARDAALRAEAAELEEAVALHRQQRAVVERLSARHAAARSAFEAVELHRQRLLAIQSALREQEVLVETLTRRQTTLERELDELLLRYATLRAQQEEAEREVAELERRGERARLRAEQDALERRLRRLRELAAQREELERAERPAPSSEELDRAERAWAATAEARGGAQVQATLRAERPLQVRIDEGGARVLGPGDVLEHLAVGELSLELAETARLVVRIAGHDPARLAALEASYRSELEPFGAADLGELRALHLEARRRSSLLARIEAEAAGLLEPGQDLASLEAQRRTLEGELARTAPASEPAPQLHFSFSFEDVRARARRTAEELREVQTALEEIRRAEGELAMERQLGERARQAAQRELGEVLDRFGSLKALQESWEASRRTLEAARAELAAVEGEGDPARPDPELRLVEIGRELELIADELRVLRDREVSSRTRLEDAGREGLHEQAARQAEELEREEHELEREEQRARGTRLLAVLARRTREEMASALVQPLARELGRCLARVSGLPEREVLLDESFRLRGVRGEPASSLEEMLGSRASRLLVLDQLSGGTREQLALIYRLALGRALASEERLPVVLDDPLGETDDERQARLLELLDAESDHLQIVILTCRPERYAALRRRMLLELPAPA